MSALIVLERAHQLGEACRRQAPSGVSRPQHLVAALDEVRLRGARIAVFGGRGRAAFGGRRSARRSPQRDEEG
jgi:hypothetical protein